MSKADNYSIFKYIVIKLECKTDKVLKKSHICKENEVLTTKILQQWIILQVCTECCTTKKKCFKLSTDGGLLYYYMFFVRVK